MSEYDRWMVVGPGNIGNEVIRQLGQAHVAERLGLNTAPSFIIRSAGIYGPDGQTQTGHANIEEISDVDMPDVAFIALPSTDDGEVAKGYISNVLESGRIAITAEKGAMANYFEELRQQSGDFDRLGFNATVGGGTRMLELAKSYCHDVDNITQVHLALNGTLSAIMSMIAPKEGYGMSLGQAVHQAVELNYAEPGSASPLDVIRAEAEGDIPKKTAIAFNVMGLTREPINWKDLQFNLDKTEIENTLEEARIRRFIVSLYSPTYLKSNKAADRDIYGGFRWKHEGWTLVGGFQNIGRNPLFSHLANLTGPGNGIVIGLGPDETDGVYTIGGPGAGVRPTVNTMIDDYVVLSAQSH